MTALERAARAVSECIDRTWDIPGDENFTTSVARAVLMAVREPSVDMSEAIMQNFADPCWPEDAKQGFTAMIDAILNEKDTTNDHDH